ncbi:methylated-DNA--[protein]-cysteine S-methyltransferase [Tumebacillus sp. ITR2]|uniref:Methylated-DNA--protein-cysteine methyltransferase n=1 Tax=Tumebacillus amylolyticus TaxID=2801339 RepID=A0ABS1JAC0_9BACL|nr:methylated-DNA--[protein]-cysteine S-methyltransferase [Tumebacillus amylolyticus]MBL0387222.1 methylated-DNA--[protein]-cysteine S-methyltransferase [Tumebacillus amylolyticus]
MIVKWTPFRDLFVAATDRGVCCITLPNESWETLRAWVSKQLPGAELVEDAESLAGVIGELEAYYRGELRVFASPLDLRGTEFQREVWQTVAQIPMGETRSYSEIAREIDRPRAVRAVGAANGANPVPILVPCHRVIGSSGHLTGYRGGLPMKKELLTLEGL